MAAPSRASRALRAAIRGYQRLTAGSAPHCRYLPTCSQYAIEAIETHGAWRGSGLALRRIGRCHPWGGHGFDPVPPVRAAGSAATDGAAHPC